MARVAVLDVVKAADATEHSGGMSCVLMRATNAIEFNVDVSPDDKAGGSFGDAGTYKSHEECACLRG